MTGRQQPQPGLGLVFTYALLILGGCRPTAAWHWERAEAGLPRQTVVLALAADPADPGRLWAGYYAPGGLGTSQDGGRTWLVGGQGLGDNPIFDLLALGGDQVYAAVRDGLFRSDDGGTTWVAVTGTLPPAPTFALAADGTGRLYAGLDDQGLYVGEPDGDHWTPLATEDTQPDLATAGVISVAVSPDGAEIYAGTAGRGLFASQDGGGTWTPGFPGSYVPNLALDLARPEQAVASLRNRLVRTRNGGRSWDEVPVPWARDEIVSLLWPAGTPGAASQGTLWAGSGKGRVYCSQDGGDTWAALKPLPAQGGVLDLALAGDQLLAGAWTGIYSAPAHCEENGGGWVYLSPSLGIPYAKAILSAEAGLLLGTRAGLFRWSPDERRWAKVTLQHPQTGDSPPGGVTVLRAAPTNPRVIYAGTAASGLYRASPSSAPGGSDGGEENWARVPTELEVGVRDLAVSPVDENHLYMVAAWERVYQSRDGGQSWQAQWTGLGISTEIISLAIDPLDPATLYLGDEAGLYRSRYGGEDWRPVGRPLDGQTILTLQPRPLAVEHTRQAPGRETDALPPEVEGQAGVLYIGATRGVYRSLDGGQTLEPWGEGLEDISVTAFLFDPDDARNVYAGTAYAGLYHSPDGGEIWKPMDGPPELMDDVVEGMAWGPERELFVIASGGVWMGTN